MKTSILSLLFLTVASAQDVNVTDVCEDQNGIVAEDEAVSAAWTDIEAMMLEGGDEDKTGSKIIWTFDFGSAGSNETEAYDEACAGIVDEKAVVKTVEEDTIMSCKTETSDHIAYEVHLVNYFQCTGIACDEEEVPTAAALDFAVQAIDRNQNGVTCEMGAHSAASVVATGAAFVMATILALL